MPDTIVNSTRDVVIGGIYATIVGENRIRHGDEVLLVVLAHGRGRSKETTLKFANILVSGVPKLICVVYDLPNHGARAINESLNRSWMSGNVYHMLQMNAIIEQGAMEAVTILKYIDFMLPHLKITGKIMVGTSLGGYVTWRVAAFFPHLLTACVPIISSPDLPSIMRNRWHEFESQVPKIAEANKNVAFPEAVLKHMEADVEIINNLRSTSLPVLAICGADDNLVPAASTQSWAEEAAANQRVELFPKIKHEVTRGMIDLTAEYLIALHSMTKSSL